MGTEIREQSADIEQGASVPRNAAADQLRAEIRDNPWSFNFFQMVRLLERLHPERKPVGLFVAPADEIARFSSNTSLSFPASDIQTYTEAQNGPNRMTVNFMGLSAMNGPLPEPYIELLLERAHAKDHAMGEFFDIFNHRLVSLFYRGWKKYRFYIAYERTAGADDAVTQTLQHVLGLGTPGLKRRMAVADEAALFYAGILGQTRRTAQGLQQILADYFLVPVRIEQFTGTWNQLPLNNQTLMVDGNSASERLGSGAVLGHEVWDRGGTVTVRLGPMPLALYRDFLPGGTAAAQLASWLKFYARGELDFLVRLVLQRDEVPGVALTSQPEAMARLGFASWLKLKPFTTDPEEAVYRL